MPNSPKDAKEKDSRPPTLHQLLDFGAKDITQRALSGQLKRAYGRDAEVARVLASLERKRSVLLLGAADVGKTAILHEAVLRMIRPQGSHCPEALAGAWVVAVSTGDVLTGTHYLGEWQTRLTELLELVKRGGKLLLYFEDIWALRDAGRASDKAEGFATLIRPYLERGDVQLLGETTPDNFHAASYGARALADDQSLLRNFDVLTVEEPTSEATKTILTQVAKSLRAGGAVRVETSAIERALELSRRFLPYAAFPGKAIRLLDEAAQNGAGRNGAEQNGSTTKSAAATTTAGTAERVIASDEVTAAFSKMTGLPEKILSDRIGLKQSEIRAYFEERVIGQEAAVGAVADVVTLVKAEMNDPTRPLGILFFVGPTGVGKTELAKTLAEYLFGSKEKLIRLDMSEFKSSLSISDFLSQLTEKQRRQTFSVLLLDEIEKASPAVFDLFLQVFGDGRLSDASGRSVDLRNTIIIMTSNLGNVEVEELTPRSKAIGFLPASAEEAKEGQDAERVDAAVRAKAMRSAVEGFFRPEFINRLDRIVVFQPLGRDELRRIARRELGKALLREGIVRRNILIEPRDEVFDALLAQGYSPQYGARPMQRVIGELVLLPLARAIAEQPAMGEQLLELVVRDGRIETEVIPLEASEPEPVAEEPHERVSVLDAQTGRVRSLDARGLEQVIEEQRLRVEQHLAGERYEQLSARQQTLMEEMNRPSFWDNQERSRRVLAEIYHIDTMRNRLTDLRNRVEGLGEAARMIRLHSDTQGRSRLVASYERLAQDVAMAEMELIASGGAAAGIETLFLRILPRPHKPAEAPEEGHAWAREVEGMYLGWARRKGYDAEALAEAAESVERLLLLRGPNLCRMLAGEAGVHRMEGDSESEPPAGRARRKPGPAIFLAHVELFPALDDEEPQVIEGMQVRVLADEGDGSGERREGERREGERRSAGRGFGRGDGRARMVAEASDAKSGLVVRVRAAEAERVARLLLLARLARPVAEPASEEVVRVYRVGKTQYVHDKRTGERDGQPKRVLGGGIDRFLLAYLGAQQEEPARATERDGHAE